MTDLEFVTTFNIARAGLRNSLDDMRDVRTSDRRTILVGSLAIEEIFRGGWTEDVVFSITALWNPFLVEWCRLRIWLENGKGRGFNPTCWRDVGLIGILGKSDLRPIFHYAR
jgi:hypothetical protein